MRRIAFLAAAAASLVASSAFAALSVSVEKGTSSNVDAATADVYFIKVSSTTATTPLFASAVTVNATTGTILFPDGDANGGLNPTSANATNLAARANPDGTFAAIPGVLAYIATNNDNLANADPNDDLDFSTGSSHSINLVSTRTGSYQAAANPFILGAIVVSKGGTGNVVINVSSDGNDTANFTGTYPIPEPATLAAVGLAGLGLVRRRK